MHETHRETGPDNGRALTDRDLVERVALGDEAAFMTVYDRHADALFGTALRFLRDREAAAEVVQESFLALWRRAHQFDAEAGSLAGWLMSIGRNQAIDRLRAEARRPRAVYAWAGDTDSPDAADLLDLAGRRHGRSADHDPEVELDRRWTRALVRTTLSEMPPDEVEMVVLAYDRAMSQSQIADHLGVPIGTVKSRTRRALARLRTRLADVPDLRPSSLGQDASSRAVEGPLR